MANSEGHVLSGVHCVGSAEALTGSDGQLQTYASGYHHRLSSFTISCNVSPLDGWVMKFLATSDTESCLSEEREPIDDLQLDDDGDPVLNRRAARHTEVTTAQQTCIAIEHSMATALKDVGLQVWSSAFLLCDFIIWQRALFRDSTVLELGCGPGLVGIVAAVCRPKAVICTDIADVLPLCKRNIERNQHLYPPGVVTLVKDLNWLNDYGEFSSSPSEFGWNAEHLRLTTHADYLLASDVVYDEDLTEAFFRWLHYLMSSSPTMTAFLATEKRLNFSVDLLEVASPAHAHFEQCMEQLTNCNCDMHRGMEFRAAQIPLEFPCYNMRARSQHMGMIRIVLQPDASDAT
ncbi:methyltransferase-like protein 22 [Sycon ciliatum]|uniref:methyltransferase-like protein 22 n=1 Tax=Sycon ciliatum TaxID=27933 RepID=UPI0020AAC1DE|eukprot:scpid82901/ scgid35379/ Methyltransferase-like protein 22